MSLVAAILAMLSSSPQVKHTHRCVHALRAKALAPLVARAAEKTGVRPTLISAVAVKEAGGRLHAISREGAVGPMQVLPHGRASYLCKKMDLYKAASNVLCGAILLLDAQARCGGEPENWLSAYNNYPCGVTAYSRSILEMEAKGL